MSNRKERREEERRLRKLQQKTGDASLRLNYRGATLGLTTNIDLSAHGYAPKKELRITTKGGVKADGTPVSFNEAAIDLPKDKLIQVGRNLQTVSKSDANPLLIASTLGEVAAASGIDTLPVPVRLFFIDQALPRGTFSSAQEDYGHTYFDRDANVVVSIVSLRGMMLNVADDRAHRGTTVFSADYNRLMANLMYRLSEHTAHELFHAGRHMMQGDDYIRAHNREIEEETRVFSQEFARRVQYKETPPLVVAQQIPFHLL